MAQNRNRPNFNISMDGEVRDRIHEQMSGMDNRSRWIESAVRMRLEIAEAVETAGMADELDDDWWRDWLYDAAREHLRERRERETADEEEREGIEAD